MTTAVSCLGYCCLYSLADVTVWGNSTVAEVVCETLHEAGVVLTGSPTGPLSAPQVLPLAEPLPQPEVMIAPPTALLFLGGSKAPVEPRSSAMCLEGEVLVVEHEPQAWDGKDLEVFLAWEKIYASTLFSALELYGKPLLRAAVITKEEYHLLFYYLESVSEASEALTLRMRRYIDSGLLKSKEETGIDEKRQEVKEREKEEERKSILTELIQEGILSQQDIDLSSLITETECSDEIVTNNKLDDDNRSSVSSVCCSLRKMAIDIPVDNCESVIESPSIIESSDNVTTVTIRSGGQCCADHRISADVSENVWSNVKWDFLNPADFGYDQVPNVKRSRSDSALSPVTKIRNEELYERLHNEEESCGSMTPYESIEDLYDCIKKAAYNNIAAEESSPSTEYPSELHYPVYFEKSSATRQSSASSEKSGTSSAFPFSKCGSSDSTGAYTSCESTSGVSSFIPKNIPESLKCRELPPPPEVEINESTILLKQLFMGELLDAYGEYLSAYPYARALLRRKSRRDEHFMALADIRRGAAKYTIGDYLELPRRLCEREAAFSVLIKPSTAIPNPYAQRNDYQKKSPVGRGL
ncbi:jg3388 [Pararge aegeria aegeria]|uniref:Jg3388 protein n=1 Tax=Pararge aegeria aegeria TaxID=348720 RepID=A0A8S4RTV1_9NEOP|nr:jg3388 [Pararge aegeria aegeria]